MAQLGVVLTESLSERVLEGSNPHKCGIVASHCNDLLCENNMLRQLLSVTQTAERLRVRPDYVRELVAKKRLTFIHGEQLDAAEVEQLAKLMDKLRKNGIATLVEITAQNDKFDN